MQKGTAATIAFLFFGAALAADLFFTATGRVELRPVSKPLIVLSLVAYFLASVQQVTTPRKWWVATALGFSWLGDVLLLFEGRSPLYFILGLSFFLLAHGAYSVFFNHLRKEAGVRIKPLSLVIISIYYLTLVVALYPYLDGMRLPVVVYGGVISMMLVLALNVGLQPRRTRPYIVLGALLFVLSDSVLALNKFMRPFAGAGVLIMLTYGMAQFFIVSGSILALENRDQDPVVSNEKDAF